MIFMNSKSQKISFYFILSILFVSLFSSMAEAKKATDCIGFICDNKKTESKKISAGIHTNNFLNSFKGILPIADPLNCEAPSFHENGRMKSFATCKAPLNLKLNFEYYSRIYESLDDKSLPLEIKNYLTKAYSVEELVQLKDRRIAVKIRLHKKTIAERRSRIDRCRTARHNGGVVKAGRTCIQIESDNDNAAMGLAGIFIEKPNDVGHTHGLRFSGATNIKDGLNVIYELDMDLFTQSVGDKKDCSGDRCQEQFLLSRRYLGAGLQKEIYNEDKGILNRVTVKGGVVDQSGECTGNIFDPCEQQRAFHSAINQVYPGGATEFVNMDDTMKNDTGGYISLEAQFGKSLMRGSSNLMLSNAYVEAGGKLQLETNGMKEVKVFAGASATLPGKYRNHGFGISVVYGIHNREKGTLVDFETEEQYLEERDTKHKTGSYTKGTVSYFWYPDFNLLKNTSIVFDISKTTGSDLAVGAIDDEPNFGIKLEVNGKSRGGNKITQALRDNPFFNPKKKDINRSQLHFISIH